MLPTILKFKRFPKRFPKKILKPNLTPQPKQISLPKIDSDIPTDSFISSIFSGTDSFLSSLFSVKRTMPSQSLVLSQPLALPYQEHTPEAEGDEREQQVVLSQFYTEYIDYFHQLQLEQGTARKLFLASLAASKQPIHGQPPLLSLRLALPAPEHDFGQAADKRGKQILEDIDELEASEARERQIIQSQFDSERAKIQKAHQTRLRQLEKTRQEVEAAFLQEIKEFHLTSQKALKGLDESESAARKQQFTESGEEIQKRQHISRTNIESSLIDEMEKADKISQSDLEKANNALSTQIKAITARTNKRREALFQALDSILLESEQHQTPPPLLPFDKSLAIIQRNFAAELNTGGFSPKSRPNTGVSSPTAPPTQGSSGFPTPSSHKISTPLLLQSSAETANRTVLPPVDSPTYEAFMQAVGGMMEGVFSSLMEHALSSQKVKLSPIQEKIQEKIQSECEKQVRRFFQRCGLEQWIRESKTAIKIDQFTHAKEERWYQSITQIFEQQKQKLSPEWRQRLANHADKEEVIKRRLARAPREAIYKGIGWLAATLTAMLISWLLAANKEEKVGSAEEHEVEEHEVEERSPSVTRLRPFPTMGLVGGFGRGRIAGRVTHYFGHLNLGGLAGAQVMASPLLAFQSYSAFSDETGDYQMPVTTLSTGFTVRIANLAAIGFQVSIPRSYGGGGERPFVRVAPNQQVTNINFELHGSLTLLLGGLIGARKGQSLPREALEQVQSYYPNLPKLPWEKWSKTQFHIGNRRAESMAKRIGVRAFALGEHIFFGAGQFLPTTRGGQNLIAHEMTHVAQFLGGGPLELRMEGGGLRDRKEQEAEQAARRSQDTFRDGGKTGPFFPADLAPGDARARWTPEDALGHGALVFVNGIQTTLIDHYKAAQSLAIQLGRPVVGVCKVTEGFVMDAIGVLADKANDRSHNPAIATLVQIMKDHPRVEIYAHSRGSLQTSEALRQVKAAAHGNAGSIAGLTVTTFGNAAYTYPQGPAYHHYVMDSDAVPALFGTNNLISGLMGRLAGGVPARNVTVLHSREGLIGPHNVDKPSRENLDYIRALPRFQAEEARQRTGLQHEMAMYLEAGAGVTGAIARGIGQGISGGIGTAYNAGTGAIGRTLRGGASRASSGLASAYNAGTQRTGSLIRATAQGAANRLASGYDFSTRWAGGALRGGAQSLATGISYGYNTLSNVLPSIPGMGGRVDQGLRRLGTATADNIAGGYSALTNRADGLIRTGAQGTAREIEQGYSTVTGTADRLARLGGAGLTGGISRGYGGVTGFLDSLARSEGRLVTDAGAGIMSGLDWALERTSGAARLQRSESSAAGPHPDVDAGSLLHGLKKQSSGFQPDSNLRGKLGGHLGFDPGGARLHTGPAAAQSARRLNAEAFTIGKDVFFGEGRYDPSSSKGLGLIAHELTHVGQQTGTTGDKTRFFTGRGGDEMEQEAQQVGARVLANAGRNQGVSVGLYDRLYEGDGEDELTASDRQRLDMISLMALTEAENLLWQRGIKGRQSLDSLEVSVSLDLARMSNQEAAQAWAEAIVASIVRQREQTSGNETAVIQRYQAGRTGHGGIEEEGLRLAGFSGDMEHGDIGAIYFGNWLRDFSQLNSGAAMRQIINILALGEFNRTATNEELGYYVPSEHLDNPLVGGTAEDRLATAAERNASISHLSDEQRRALNDPMLAGAVRSASLRSGLPEYIERGKLHSKAKLEEAIRLGHTQAGMMAMGNGLHAIEDYFSHSNFVEVAMDLLAHQGSAPQRLLSSSILDKDKNQIHFDAAAAGGRDALGREKIITGTYEDSNSTVSMIETLKTEVLTGQLGTAFIRGWRRAEGRAAGTVAAFPSRVLGAAALGTGGVLVEGATGLVHGFERGHGFLGTIGSAMSGLGHGAVYGAEHGAELGWDATGGPNNPLYAAGNLSGQAAAVAQQQLLLMIAAPLFLEAITAAKIAAIPGGLMDKSAETHTAATPAAARKAVVAHHGTLADENEAANTHSLLAKDSPDHPLFAISRSLAVQADEDIGKAMLAAWAGTLSPEQVTALVDVYVSRPETQNWWRQPLTDAMAASAPTMGVAGSSAAQPSIQRSASLGNPADGGPQEQAAQTVEEAFVSGLPPHVSPMDLHHSPLSVQRKPAAKTERLSSPYFTGDPTMESIYHGLRAALRSGDTGKPVERVQQALSDLGFREAKYGVDGKFGDETRTAVVNFQSAKGLDPDGKVGADTLRELEKAVNAPPQAAPDIAATDNALGKQATGDMDTANTVATADAGIYYQYNYRAAFPKKWKPDYISGYANPFYFERLGFMDWRLKPGCSASAGLKAWLKGLTIAECNSSLVAMEIDSLRAAIGDAKFDAKFGSATLVIPEAQRLRIKPGTKDTPVEHYMVSTDAAKKNDAGTEGKRPANAGEWYYFYNHPKYLLKHPGGAWQGENSLCMGIKGGKQLWSGLGASNVDEAEMFQEMIDDYNGGRTEDDYRKLRQRFPGVDPVNHPEQLPPEYREGSGAFPSVIGVADILNEPPYTIDGTTRKGGFVANTGMHLDAAAVQKTRDEP